MTTLNATKTVEVYDPAMCCSTGVCGPSVDPRLAQFAGDLDWLGQQGVSVRRYNLSQEPGAFAERAAVRTALDENGEACLPLLFVDGELVSQATYPSRAELSDLAGLYRPAGAESVWGPAVKELVAIAAAIASGCEPCLEHHVGTARTLGVCEDDMARTVRMARAVKDVPARSIEQLADTLLGTSTDHVTPQPLPVAEAPASNCCS